jgi:hypothetical protein
LINHLVFCFTKDPDCELFNTTVLKNKAEWLKASNYYLSRYVGVKQGISYASVQHQALFAYHLGDPIKDGNATYCDEKSKNDKEFTYMYLNGPLVNSSRDSQCYRSTANLSSTLSPAFEEQDWDKYSEFPAWTESRWQGGAFQLDVFLVPSRTEEIRTLLIGLAVFLLSIPITFLLSKRLHLRGFSPLDDSAHPRVTFNRAIPSLSDPTCQIF